MPKKNYDPNQNVPDRSSVALLLVDVINDLAYPENKSLLRALPRFIRTLLRLKKRATEAGIPVIYVNDNFGKWQSSFEKHFDHCVGGKTPGCSLAIRLKPDADNYFVLKPKHSGFFSTTLETLLRYLGAETLVITGIAGDRCVLFTASDAYLRDFRVFVPGDCVLSNTPAQNRQALQLMKRVLHADIRKSPRLNFSKLKRLRSNCSFNQ